MVRLRNQKTISKVVDASWRLFGKKGYNATSYADVSAASGVKRATVQHYFPKKELMATENLKRLRSCTVDIADQEYPELEHSFAKLYLLGQIYIASLLCCEEARRFFCDVLENRALTNDTISRDFAWSIDYTLGDNAVGETDSELRQDIVVSMGGLYELMFQCIRNDDDLDIAKRLKPSFRNFSLLHSLSAQETDQVFDTYAIDNSRLYQLGQAAYEQTFKQPVSAQA